jgi:hypothetical protein
MSVTLWDSEQALEAGERAVRNRPVSDQRDIRPSRVERWIIDASFCQASSSGSRDTPSARPATALIACQREACRERC